MTWIDLPARAILGNNQSLMAYDNSDGNVTPIADWIVAWLLVGRRSGWAV